MNKIDMKIKPVNLRKKQPKNLIKFQKSSQPKTKN